MSTLQSKWAKGNEIVKTGHVSGSVMCTTFVYSVLAASAPVINDIIEMGALPGNNRVVDMILDCDDLDSGTALALDVGIMSGDFGDEDAGGARTVGDEFFDGSTLGQAGGIARMSEQGGFNVAKAELDRGIGVKIATAATTTLDGEIRLHVFYVAA